MADGQKSMLQWLKHPESFRAHNNENTRAHQYFVSSVFRE
jgi:hypothetical protein